MHYFTKMKDKKKNVPAVSLGFALLGVGLIMLADALIEKKPIEKPIETEDGGYAEEVKD